MASIQVFSGIELPKKRHRGATPKYPTEFLEVGACFFDFPKEGEDLEHARKRILSSSARVRALHPERRFTARVASHPESGEECVGVWRVEDKTDSKVDDDDLLGE